MLLVHPLVTSFCSEIYRKRKSWRHLVKPFCLCNAWVYSANNHPATSQSSQIKVARWSESTVEPNVYLAQSARALYNSRMTTVEATSVVTAVRWYGRSLTVRVIDHTVVT